jgi:phosphoribosylamine--glycine ligase
MRWPGRFPNRPLTDTLFCAPGNAGIAKDAEIVALDVNDAGAVASFCKVNGVGLVVVGPEAPLVAGLADALRAGGIKVFGPSAAAARLEGSKGSPRTSAQNTTFPQVPMAGFHPRPMRLTIWPITLPRSWSRQTGWLPARASLLP